MKKNTLTAERNRDFIDACKRHPLWPQNRGAAAEAVASTASAPSFYLDGEYAYRRLIRMRHGGKMPTSDSARRRWLELNSKVDDYRRKNPTSLFDAVMTVVLNEQASAFYISGANARRIANNY